MKVCKQCSLQFEVAQQDLAFYETMKVPEPTLCPSCRMQRRMCIRNERKLYKRKCDFTGEDIVSMYPPDTPFKVYNQFIWWSDKWNVFDYARDFDFSRPFFEQFYELMLDVPRTNLQNRANENSGYCNDTSNLKNSYLCFNGEQGENYYYCNTFGFGRDSMDCFWCLATELCYECLKVHESYHCFWCMNCKSISDCFFCDDCLGCKNCFGCIGLRQKEYYIYNEQKTKDEFESFMNEFNFTYENIENTKSKMSELRLSVPHKNLSNINCENCLGDYISDSKNCIECFDAMNSENSKYVWDVLITNSYDCYNSGLSSSYCYEDVGVYNSNNVRFSNRLGNGCSDCEYCDYCNNVSNCFGCIGLVKKSYCILNKQYSKEEYEKLVPKIIEYMKKTGEYGEFFPPSISPVCYNDSMAVEYFPLTKAEALAQGFIWNDYIQPKVEGTKTIPASRLPDVIFDTPDDILNWAIECKKCSKPFKLVSQELKFYRNQGLPVPHKCPDCRHYARKARINPRVLYDRKCDKCGCDMKTTYSLEHPETVYCEECYLKEVY